MAGKHILGFVAAAALVGLVITALPVHGAQPDADILLPQVQQINGISYVSGGIGEDEVKAMRSIAGRFNVRLGFYDAKGGAALSDVVVTIEDTRGERRLRVVIAGPLLYMQLPPATYTVRAQFRGDSQSRKFTVGRNAINYLFRLRINELEDGWVYCESRCPRRGR
ncbi:hypothetical protein [Cupriavidus basilensis]|uniref:Putative exported protein n=1 Tax=Cupriavidus basilensis TaxID=68895 RepID=A0A0C4YNL0_9BURK|nr:hypothetical protein [Cupriavidus basilensis]AJG24100.1 putative exported protein [Cupriavidus basilensis]